VLALCPALVKQKQNTNSWARSISTVLLCSNPPIGAIYALVDIYNSKGGAAVRWSAHHGFCRFLSLFVSLASLPGLHSIHAASIRFSVLYGTNTQYDDGDGV
jgi:hypothetical protein